MASTTAMFTGLSGLTANARNLDVIGNNIANVNTIAYKSSRLLFSTAFARTFSLGSGPSAVTGGTNPGQIGLGVSIAGTQRDFTGGAISATGDGRDLAIEGDGFFIVSRGGQQLYTRAGAFRPNALNQLVTVTGERVMGFGVDQNFNIIPGRLQELSIPIGSLTIAEATRNVRFTGNLNAGGAVPTQGSTILFQALTDLTSNPAGPATLLTDIEDSNNPGNALFAAGQSITLSGIEKGSKVLPSASFDITATTTVQDLLDFLTAALGIDTTSGPNPDGATPGVTIDPATGQITIVGNTGAANDIAIDTADIRLMSGPGGSGNALGQPFTPDKTASADGESVRTTFVVFDSLGTPIDVDIVLTLESRGGTAGEGGTVWRYHLESEADSDLSLFLGSGTIAFDAHGQVTGSPDIPVIINRAGTGAQEPLSFTVSFASDSDNVTALTSQTSGLAATYQDGSPLGTLSAYAIGQDGTIYGAFTNGLSRVVGQIALAAFSNPEGLIDEGGNMYAAGPNSGAPVVTTPQDLGTGRIVGGALELSNVELSQEFINLILASTGYSASSRVITTADQLFQQLLVVGR